MDLSLREILERYKDDSEILKHVLTAKIEEDKKIAAQDTLKIEQTRIQLRELDLELMREHGKATIRYYDDKKQQQPTARYTTPPPLPAPIQPSLISSSSNHHYNNNSSNNDGSKLPPISSYQGLAPVQQQVLARITSNDPRSSPSSYETYPHSAHPLCLPSSSSLDENRRNNHRLYITSHTHHQSSTPISPGGVPDEFIIRKRVRNSVNEISSENNGSNNNNNSESNLSHDQVMEALKAKIQRGNSISSSNNNINGEVDRNNSNNNKKRARASVIKVEVDRDSIAEPSTPSPRSAKPILPPIDTSMGRDRTQYNHNDNNNNNSKYRITTTTTTTTAKALSSSSSGDHPVQEPPSTISSLSSAKQAEKPQEAVKSEANPSASSSSSSSSSSSLSEPNTSS